MADTLTLALLANKQKEALNNLPASVGRANFSDTEAEKLIDVMAEIDRNHIPHIFRIYEEGKQENTLATYPLEKDKKVLSLMFANTIQNNQVDKDELSLMHDTLNAATLTKKDKKALQTISTKTY